MTIPLDLTDDVRELLNDWPIGWTFGLRRYETVVVAGAYRGRVVDLIDQVYHPLRIFGFDPQPWAIAQAQERVGDRPNVQLFPYGIGLADGVFPMGEWETDACSFVNTGYGARLHGYGAMREITRAFEQLGIEQVGLFVMNMEGYEFDLIPHMYESGLLKLVDRLIVQFHFGFGNDESFEDLCLQLDDTHDMVSDDSPRWVYWKRRA